MSDFLTRLINRHIGVGEQVRPRVRTRFEPDAPAVSLRQDVPKIVEMNTEVHSVRRQPASITESPGATPQAVSEAAADIDKRVVPNGHVTPDTLQQESAVQNVSEDVNVACPRSFEKSVEQKTGNTGGRLVPATRDVHSLEILQTSEPAIFGHDGSRNQRSDQAQLVASERTSGASVSFANQQPGMTESELGTIALENANADSPDLPATPTWLSDQQSQLGGELFVEDSKAEVEPAVNVTIGRIEVRAIVPQESKQPARETKPSGVMSLDKYLHQRTRRMNR